MATSGSFETTARISGSYNTKAKFSWWQTGQSVSGNYTDISWKLEGVTASQYQYIYVYGVSVTVNGGTTSKSFNGKMYNGTELASGSARIYHNNDGTKSFSASASIEQYSTGSWYSGSNSWTLNTIARASQPSINTYPNNSPDFNVGDTITIHMNQAADSFTHTVKMNYGSSSYTIATGVKYNCTFNTSTLANELYALMPSSTNYGSTISVTTYNGSTNIGTKTCAYNAKAVEANVKPQFSDFEYADTNSAVTAITGNNQYLVQGKSTLAVTVPRIDRALPRMYTSMANYISSLSGKTVSAAYDSESDVVMTFSDNAFTPGTQTLAVKATDARGYSTSVNKNINVIAYSSPTIAATATRAGNFENETTLHIEGTFAPVTIEGTAKNTVTNVKYRYKKQSTSTWGSWINMSGLTPTSAGAYTTTNVVLNLANTDAWDIQVQTTDRFETSTASLTVSVGVPVFRIGTDGYVYNNEQPLMPSHVGQVIMSTTLDTAAKVQAIYGGTWEAWGAGRVPVGVDPNDTDFNAPNKTGGSKTVSCTFTIGYTEYYGSICATSLRAYKRVDGGYAPAVRDGSASFAGNSGRKDGTATSSNNAYASTGQTSKESILQPYIALYMWRRSA